MNTFLALRSLRYYMFSKHKNGHGIHSPFVYTIINRVLKNKTDSSIVSLVESSRKKFSSDHSLISVTDLGSGSLRMKSKQRRVKDIVRYASVRPSYVRVLSGLAALVDGRDIVELGTSLGLGTICLALGAPQSSIITIEGCPNTAGMAKNNFEALGLSNIDLRVANFDDVFEGVLQSLHKPGLVYIDGNHRSEALLRYMKTLIPYLDDDTIVLIDDIHQSRDMEGAWKSIIGMDFVAISVDLLQMGLLFFKKGIRKQDFVIRY